MVAEGVLGLVGRLRHLLLGEGQVEEFANCLPGAFNHLWMYAMTDDDYESHLPQSYTYLINNIAFRLGG